MNKKNRLKDILRLSFALARNSFKLKNEGTFLGILWNLIGPILTFIILYFVFSNSLGKEILYYPIYLFLGIIVFNFFQYSTSESIRAIQDNKNITKSINFPRESLVFSIVLRNLFSHIFEILILLVLMFFFSIKLYAILFYIPIFIVLILFVLGISLILAAISVYFSDLEMIWQFLSRILWLGTPIFYSSNLLRKEIGLLNPMNYFVNISRDVVIYHNTPSIWMIIAIVIISLISLFIGLYIFRRLENKFAEMV